jgi:hypothetical protein
MHHLLAQPGGSARFLTSSRQAALASTERLLGALNGASGGELGCVTWYAFARGLVTSHADLLDYRGEPRPLSGPNSGHSCGRCSASTRPPSTGAPWCRWSTPARSPTSWPSSCSPASGASWTPRGLLERAAEAGRPSWGPGRGLPHPLQRAPRPPGLGRPGRPHRPGRRPARGPPRHPHRHGRPGGDVPGRRGPGARPVPAAAAVAAGRRRSQGRPGRRPGRRHRRLPRRDPGNRCRPGPTASVPPWSCSSGAGGSAAPASTPCAASRRPEPVPSSSSPGAGPPPWRPPATPAQPRRRRRTPACSGWPTNATACPTAGWPSCYRRPGGSVAPPAGPWSGSASPTGWVPASASSWPNRSSGTSWTCSASPSTRHGPTSCSPPSSPPPRRPRSRRAARPAPRRPPRRPVPGRPRPRPRRPATPGRRGPRPRPADAGPGGRGACRGRRWGRGGPRAGQLGPGPRPGACGQGGGAVRPARTGPGLGRGAGRGRLLLGGLAQRSRLLRADPAGRGRPDRRRGAAPARRPDRLLARPQPVRRRPAGGQHAHLPGRGRTSRLRQRPLAAPGHDQDRRRGRAAGQRGQGPGVRPRRGRRLPRGLAAQHHPPAGAVRSLAARRRPRPGGPGRRPARRGAATLHARGQPGQGPGRLHRLPRRRPWRAVPLPPRARPGAPRRPARPRPDPAGLPGGRRRPPPGRG